MHLRSASLHLLGAAGSSGDTTDQVADSASRLWDAAVRSLPRVGVAAIVIVASWGIGRAVRSGGERLLARRHTPSFSTVMAKLCGWAVTILGVLLALAVTFPSVRPVDLLAGLGFFSLAIGFAFQDILENLLAGIVLLFRQPFVGGDQIQVGDAEGTVERITVRETVITTWDGERILVPNADVYKNAVRILTAHPRRGTGFVVGVAYETDLERARTTARDALASVAGVRSEPPPEALVLELTGSTVDLEVRFWSSPHELVRRRVLDRAIAAVKVAFDDAGIEMPAGVVALQAASSFEAALHGRPVTPGGAVAHDARRPG